MKKKVAFVFRCSIQVLSNIIKKSSIVTERAEMRYFPTALAESNEITRLLLRAILFAYAASVTELVIITLFTALTTRFRAHQRRRMLHRAQSVYKLRTYGADMKEFDWMKLEINRQRASLRHCRGKEVECRKSMTLCRL